MCDDMARKPFYSAAFNAAARELVRR